MLVVAQSRKQKYNFKTVKACVEFSIDVMEHYVICIWNGSVCGKNKVVTDYLSTLFPDAFQYCHVAHFAEEIAVLLKPVSKYIAVLNTCQENETVDWLDLNVEDIISKESTNDCESEFLSKDTIENISTTLHSLADELPAYGTYKLDVLLDGDVLSDLSVRKEPVLAGAFIRLTRWHSARFNIFEKTKCDRDKLNEWCEIINAYVLQQHSNLGPTLWRGALSANTATDEAFYDGFELKLDRENDYHIFHSSKNNAKQVSLVQHIVVSSKLQVINEVNFASIPSYLIPPVKFRLYLGRLNVLNEKSYRFVDHLLSNDEVALILRLEYAEINAKTKPERKYCTNRWQKAILSHNLRDPQCFVSLFDKFITFAVTRSKSSDDIIAYPLQKSALDVNFYFTLINSSLSLPCYTQKEKSTEENGSISAEVPIVSGSLFQSLLSKYVNQKAQYLKNGSLPSITENNSNFSSLMESFRNIATTSSFKVGTSSGFILEEVDPSDWPERIQLLQKQMQDETKEFTPANRGQNLKLPQQCFSLSTDFITQYFLPSGEHKNLINVENIYQLNSDHLVTYDFNKVLHSKWPEITNCTYHDIYYNSNLQAEDKENLGSQMVKLYVQHETASTCNNQQIIQNFSITIAEKSSTPRKEFRSPSCRAANSGKRRRFENGVSPRESSLKALINSKILSSSKALFGENISKINQFTKVESKKKLNKNLVPVRCSPRKKNLNKNLVPVRCSPRKKNLNKNLVPVRCSPRKKNLNKSLAPVRCSPRKKTPVNYKHLSVNRNVKNTSKNHASSTISDLLRKKIRYAVAVALENNGINMTHAFFKPCGSKLFSICKTFLDDLALKKGKTSEYLQKIADAHVKQVIEFYQG